jgi:hypothetical protein
MDTPLELRTISVFEAFDAADHLVWELGRRSARLMVPLVLGDDDATEVGWLWRFSPMRWGAVDIATPLLVATATDYWASSPNGEAAFGAGFAVNDASAPAIGGDWSRRLTAAGFGYLDVASEVWCLSKQPFRALTGSPSLSDQARALADWGRKRIEVLVSVLEPPADRG